MNIKLAPKSIGLLIILLLVGMADGYAQKMRSERKISESFPVNTNTTLAIYNKFGKVHISTHTGNTIKVAITVVGFGASAEQAKLIADGFPVKISSSSNNIIIKSDEKPKAPRFAINSFTPKKNKRADYEINYEVSMPQNVPLILRHKFGEAYLGNYNGRLDLDVEHGNFKGERLTGNDFKNISVKFGSASLGIVEKGRIEAHHSDLSLERAGSIEFDGKNGNFELGAIGSIEGDVSYSSFKIHGLENSMVMNLRYNSAFSIGKISGNFTKIDLNSDYNGGTFNFADGDRFDFDVDLKFASLKCDPGKVTYTKQQRAATSASFAGKYGGGSSSAKVTIKGSYGDIIFK